LIALVLLGLSIPGAPLAQSDELGAALDGISFRNIGPFRTSAWVTEVAVPEAPLREHLYTMYAATRSGGLWKTVNNGTTWENLTDGIEVAAVGAVALSPSHPEQVWLGTGANDLARSSYSGTGVYRSGDGGATWEFAGLGDSHHIARIVVHPSDPDTVWVAAMGHLFSRNEERGVFRTRDGGATWDRVLYVDDGTGAVDLVIDRDAPDTLFAAMYEKHRSDWRLVLGGPGTAVYRTDDGGDDWAKLTGLPTGSVGRIGLDYNQASDVLHAIVENVNPRPEGWPARTDACSPDREIGADVIGNEVYRSADHGATWNKTHGNGVDVAGSKAPYSFNQIITNPADPSHILVNSDTMYESRDGGATWNCEPFRSVFGDFRTMWWDEQDPQRIVIGSDGGVNVSLDGGRTADYSINLPVGEVYAVGVDMEDPYSIYAGLQDHDSWKGPSRARSGRIMLEDWTTVGGGDGMYNQIDPTNSRWAYNTFQTGGQRRFDQLTGRPTNIAPQRDDGAPRLRYNWITPLILSPHNPQVLYTGAQVLFRSLDRGDRWEEISDDLTSNDERCGLNSGYVPFCTITSISESAVTPGLIWVGTDDGRVHLTRDHGGNWTDLTAAVDAAGGPADRYVSRVYASTHTPGTAFVAKNGFRNDDFSPYLLRTTDFGMTWESIAAGLPDSPINVVVQDRRNPDLLIVGNDLGVWVSIDQGEAWHRLRANLPTAPVHDLTVHPRENDLVLGTYGRAVWVGDVSLLQELDADVLAAPFHAFEIEPRPFYGFRALGNYHLFGDRYLAAPNEPEGLVVRYWLAEAADGPASIRITDIAGTEISALEGPAEAGLNEVIWDLRPGAAAAGDDWRSRMRRFNMPPAGPGAYRVDIRAGAFEATRIGRVLEREAR
jgi:photosystem II stability/assembly factor-like uncharacterized protein